MLSTSESVASWALARADDTDPISLQPHNTYMCRNSCNSCSTRSRPVPPLVFTEEHCSASAPPVKSLAATIWGNWATSFGLVRHFAQAALTSSLSTSLLGLVSGGGSDSVHNSRRGLAFVEETSLAGVFEASPSLTIQLAACVPMQVYKPCEARRALNCGRRPPPPPRKASGRRRHAA